MATSGTYNFALSNTALIMEAFDRIHVRPPEITRHMAASARNSMNLEFIDWSNIGINLWKVASGSITLAPGVATYTLDPSIEILTDVWYSQVNGGGVGQNNDRIMTPITRQQYAMIPNKLTQGTPTQYWLQMLVPRQVTVWQVPAPGAAAPTYQIDWFGLQRIQDANLAGGEKPDIAYWAYEALCARMALRLWTKFPDRTDPNHRAILKEEATDAWNNFQTRDQEQGPMIIQPQVGVYGRM